MRWVQREQHKNLLGKHKGPKSTRWARRRARKRLLAKRQASEACARGADHSRETIYDSGSESGSDVQEEGEKLDQSNVRCDGEVCDAETVRQENKPGAGGGGHRYFQNLDFQDSCIVH